MAEPKASRGRPKLAPEDNETRERILNTAQKLFAEKGFNRVTLRELTSAAETNLAAVNYYFGSKDKLLLALVKRSAKEVHKARQQLLREAENSRGSREQKVRKVIHALLSPSVGQPADNETGFLYTALISRTLADGPAELTDLLEKQTSHLDPYIEALHKILPELPREEIYWRFHFVLNIEHAVGTELKRLEHISGGLCQTDDPKALVERIIDFVVPGLMAGATGKG